MDPGEHPESVPVVPGGRDGSARPDLLTVTDLHTHFRVSGGLLRRTREGGEVRAVDGVSFRIGRGETLGLVGESGCGKTTVGRTVLRLIPATSGRVVFDGQDVFGATRTEMQRLRRRMQIVFQDPAGSLNPRMRVGAIVGEPMQVHGMVVDRDELRERALRVLERCGMPRASADRFPHEFSGGQRQRIVIARALSLEPSFVVCDEPTSALDVSIQAQILNLLKDLQRDFGLSFLFISHDMGVVQHMCDRIAVMYRGTIVETGTRSEIIGSARHGYTRSLLSAVPVARPGMKRARVVFEGGVG